MAHLIDHLLAFFQPSTDADLEQALSGAANHADVEQRLRDWEQRARQDHLNLP
jgi:hypothetical protein